MEHPYLDSNPYIEVYFQDSKGTWQRFVTYVDSGAYISILTKTDAIHPGLKLEAGRQSTVYGIIGTLKVYIHTVKIKLAGHILAAEVAFSTSSENPRLLGRKGIFEKFIVCFNDAKKIVSFS